MNVQQKLALGYIRSRLNFLARLNKKKAGEEMFRLFCTPIYTSPVRPSDIFSKHEKLQLSFQGKIVKGYRCNPGSSKKVLIVHGFSSSCHNFDSYVSPLVSAGYEVLAFDAPAHGASEGTTINALEYANLLIQIIRAYGPFDAFIGHSFGGLAICLALEQKVNSVDTRVVLIAPATETTTAINSAFTFLSLKNPVLRKALEDEIMNISGKEASWFSIRRAIKNMKAKVLWLHDEDDTVTPLSDALKVKEDNHPHIIFTLTKGLGHSRIYRDTGVKKQIFDFLR